MGPWSGGALGCKVRRVAGKKALRIGRLGTSVVAVSIFPPKAPLKEGQQEAPKVEVKHE